MSVGAELLVAGFLAAARAETGVPALTERARARPAGGVGAAVVAILEGLRDGAPVEDGEFADGRRTLLPGIGVFFGVADIFAA